MNLLVVGLLRLSLQVSFLPLIFISELLKFSFYSFNLGGERQDETCYILKHILVNVQQQRNNEACVMLWFYLCV